MKTECQTCSCREWCTEKLKSHCPDNGKVIPVIDIEPETDYGTEPEYIIIDGVKITADDLAPNDPEFEQSIMELLDC